ncbi:DUF6928 family protein [Nocardia sp. NPDC088792]|uniref:DUF6928 family protein n=1 Tax=Nocardia sp. NPDC088792 TaxID=3364332 RepID=UPI00381FBF19
MGAKTSLLAFTDGEVTDMLKDGGHPDETRTDRLLELIHPSSNWNRRPDGTLADTFPRPPIVYASSRPGLDIVCDLAVSFTRPSTLPTHWIEASQGRRLVTHSMHSTADRLAFSVWTDGQLERSLSLGPDDGIYENIGTPMPFEAPYWAGEHPVEVDDNYPLDSYPLPFHPLELGEHALRALFGFVLEAVPRPTDIDPTQIPMLGYEITDTAAQ